MGLLYLSGLEDRSLERAVERSAREHDSHVGQDSNGGTRSTFAGGASGLRGKSNVGAEALTDAATVGSSNDTGSDDDFEDAGSPGVDPEGQLQEEFKQEVTQAGVDELKSFLKAGDADPSESLDEEEEQEDGEEGDEEEKSDSAEAEVDGKAEPDDDASDGASAEREEKKKSKNTNDSDGGNDKGQGKSEGTGGGDEEDEADEKDTVTKIVETVTDIVKPLIGGDESASDDAAVTSDAGKLKVIDQGDKSETAADNGGTINADDAKPEGGEAAKKTASSTKTKKTASAKSTTKIVGTNDEADTTPGDRDDDGKDDTDIVEKIVEKAANVVKNIVGDDEESGNTQDHKDTEAKKKLSTDKHRNSEEEGDEGDEKKTEGDFGGNGEEVNADDSDDGDGEAVTETKGKLGVASKQIPTTKKKRIKVVAELVADSVVATSNATHSAKVAAEEANAEELGSVVDKIADKISGADAVLEKAADAVKKVVVGGDNEEAPPSEDNGEDTSEHNVDEKASEGNGADDHTSTDDEANDTKKQEKGGDSDGEDIESTEVSPSQKEAEKNTVSVKRRDGTAKEVNAEDIGNTETKMVTAVVP